MTFLKKLGSVLLQFGKVLMPVGPELLPMILPGAAGGELSALLNVIVQMEALGQGANLTGEQKLAAAAPLVGQAFLNTSLLAGKKMSNPDAAQAAIKNITSNLADFLNAFDAGSVQSTSVK